MIPHKELLLLYLSFRIILEVCSMDMQIMGGGPQQITAAEFAAKAKSKREVYLLLTI